ncbi:MAG TPA: hypothetical protein DCP37_10260, partial [Dehalococcoidia bacterium]|nr:hypothetical protein [Dehalococcoidia bacterium]
SMAVPPRMWRLLVKIESLIDRRPEVRRGGFQTLPSTLITKHVAFRKPTVVVCANRAYIGA